MNAPAMVMPRRGLSTPHQRLHARTLMDLAGLDAWQVQQNHQRYFDAAQIEFPGAGARMDDVLRRLAKAECSALISALKAEARHVYE